MVLTKKILGKLVVAKTTEEMLSIAANHRFLVDEKIDLRSVKIRFDHEGLDLSKFHFCAADLSGSKLKNCNALRGSFVDCRLNRVRITAASVPGFRNLESCDSFPEKGRGYGPKAEDRDRRRFVSRVQPSREWRADLLRP